MADEQAANGKPDLGKPTNRLRTDLLSWPEAKEECLRRVSSVLPDLPALGVVFIMGGIGAALGCWWQLNIGEPEFASGVSKLAVWLRVWLGCLGATAAVFLLAKTDTSKLIHCALIAVLSGMAGPYLIMKALGVVMDVKPGLVQVGKIDAALTVVQSSTDNLEKEIHSQNQDANPQKIVDRVDETAKAATTYLNVIKSAPVGEKDKALAKTKEQLQQTLSALNTAAAVAPKQSLARISDFASEAKAAGASDIAQEAQRIIDTNPALRGAVETAALSGKVYFITPPELNDLALHDLQTRIKARFPLADIQPVVHPTRQMAPGLEIVYYRDVPSDQRIAEQLGKLIADELKTRGIIVTNSAPRKGTADQGRPAPFQFDIHIGADIAAKFAKRP